MGSSSGIRAGAWIEVSRNPLTWALRAPYLSEFVILACDRSPTQASLPQHSGHPIPPMVIGLPLSFSMRVYSKEGEGATGSGKEALRSQWER